MNKNIDKPAHLLILFIAMILGCLGHFDAAIWILLMGIYGKLI